MNLLLKQIHELKSGGVLHELINMDTGEQIKGITRFNLEVVAGNEFPRVTLDTLGDIEFDGFAQVKIVKEIRK